MTNAPSKYAQTPVVFMLRSCDAKRSPVWLSGWVGERFAPCAHLIRNALKKGNDMAQVGMQRAQPGNAAPAQAPPWPLWVCPRDQTPLKDNGVYMSCKAAHQFPVVEDIPRFVPDKT